MEERICTDPGQARKELEDIAKRMNLPITDDRVALAWSDNGNIHNSFSKEVYNEVIFPLYYQKSEAH